MALMGIGDRELADLCGMSHTTLWRRIREPDELRMGELVKLAAVLDLGVEDVLGLAGMKKALTELRREMRKELRQEIVEELCSAAPDVPELKGAAVELRLIDPRQRS
jgi:DNA-binding Xre family transcriptional regulator